MAMSAIPTGMPAFVSGLLSLGAKQLAEARAVVKNLTDVETLGATSAINTDKTGTLTMNEMMVSTLYSGGSVVQRHRPGLREDRHDRVGRGCSGARLHPPRARARARHRRHGLRRRRRDRRPDRGGARRAGGEARRQRRGDAARLPAAGRGALRLRLQVHGDVPPRDRRRGRARRRARQGRPRRRVRSLQRVRRPAQRLAGADRGRARGARRRQRAHGREGAARARVRRPA